MSRKDIVNRIRDLIRAAVPTAQIILFGSEARGEARADSDIDVLVLLDGGKLTLDEEDAVRWPLYELEIQTGVSINPIITSKELWNARPFKTPFYINIINEGVVL